MGYYPSTPIKDGTAATLATVRDDGTDNALVVVQNTVPTTTVTGSVDVDNFPTTIDVGNFPTTIDVGNFPTTIDVGNFPTSITVNTITGFATEITLGLINTKLVSGTDIGDVTINNSTGVNAVNIQDGGNTITVDGTVAVNVITGFATETTLGLINTKLVSGTDIGDVTINNGTGVNAVNIQDGGNTITVDGTVTATVSNLAITQDVSADANNSSDTNLAAGAVFTGTTSSTLGVVGIQVSLRTDQKCTVYIDQAPTDALVDCPVGASAATNDTTTITGTGTYFTKNMAKGDTIVFDPTGTNQIRIVDTVVSDTVMTVTVAFTGGALTGKAFQLYPWDIKDFYVVNANDSFGVTVQAVNSYVRVRVQNISATTTTYFRLQTALCPVVEAVPRSLDANGNFKVSLKEDLQGNKIENSNLGEMQVVERNRIVGTQFDGNVVDSNFWVTSVATGTVTQTGSTVTIKSGTASPHYAAIYSNRKARFVTGTSSKYRAHIRLADTGTANVKRRWGIGQISNYLLTITSASVVAGDIYTNNGQQFTILKTETTTTASVWGTGAPAAGAQTYVKVVGAGGNLTGSAFAAQYVITDGAYFNLNGTTLTLVTCKGGTETPVANGAFNGQLGLTYRLDTNNTVYEIGYSNGGVMFMVGQVPLHKVTSTTTTWTNTMHLHIFADVINSGASSAVDFYSRAMNITRIGKLETSSRNTYIPTTATAQILKYNAGRLHKVILGDTTASGTCIFYDGITATNTISSLVWNSATDVPTPIELNIDFYNGLAVTATGTGKITIVFE